MPRSMTSNQGAVIDESGPELDRRPGARLELGVAAGGDGQIAMGPRREHPIDEPGERRAFAGAVAGRFRHLDRHDGRTPVEGARADLGAEALEEFDLIVVGPGLALERAGLAPRDTAPGPSAADRRSRTRRTSAICVLDVLVDDRRASSARPVSAPPRAARRGPRRARRSTSTLLDQASRNASCRARSP